MFFSKGSNLCAAVFVPTGKSLSSLTLGLAAVAALTAASPASANSGTAPIAASAAITPVAADGPYADLPKGSDPQFSALFSSWKRMDAGTSTARTNVASVFIPSGRPVAALSLTSNFGVRHDPFHGGARMHKGIDIPGPIGTPIYATADGIVGRAQWVNGYGNFIEISHGSGIETRYGHMSRLNVQANARVYRGQLIGFMGSTGRSTGSHLHYEVRVDGEAVNPLPFVQGTDYLVSLNTRPPVAMGGPSPTQEADAD